MHEKLGNSQAHRTVSIKKVHPKIYNMFFTLKTLRKNNNHKKRHFSDSLLKKLQHIAELKLACFNINT